MRRYDFGLLSALHMYGKLKEDLWIQRVLQKSTSRNSNALGWDGLFKEQRARRSKMRFAMSMMEE